MDGADPEMLWSRALAEGGESPGGEERARLAVWLAGLAPAERDGLRPASVAEALRLQELAARWVGDGAMEAALAAFRLAAAGLDGLSPPGAPERLDALRNLATALLRADRLDEAEAVVERLGVAAEAAGAGRDGWEAIILYHRAAIADRRGSRDQAPVLLRRALELSEQDFGALGGWSDIIRRALANSLAFLGLGPELTELCRKAARLAQADPDALRPWLLQLAEQLTGSDDVAEREAVHRRLAEVSALAFGPLEQAEDLMGLGRLLAETGRAAEALVPLGRAVAVADALASEPGLAASARFWLAETLSATEDGDPEAIHELYRAAVAGFIAAAGASDDATLYARRALGRFLARIGLPEEAELELAAALGDAEAAASPQAADLAESLTGLRRRKLAAREKGRLFAWALGREREAHGGDRLALALAVLRTVAENAEDASLRARLAAEALGVEAAALLGRGEADAALALLAGCRDGEGRADMVDALARAGGDTVVDLAAPHLPPAMAPGLAQWRLGEKLRLGDLDAALTLLAGQAEPLPALILAAARLAALANRMDEARRLARRLEDSALDRDGIELLLRLGDETAAMAAIGNLESGLAFVEGVALAAKHFAMKGERALFVRRAGEAFTHLAGHPLAADDLARALGLIAEGALELMGKDQALVWAAGQLPEALLPGFAGAMGRALEDRRGLGEGQVLEATALEQAAALAALGRWDDAVAALAGLEDAQAAIDGGIRVAEAAAQAGQADAAARCLKSAFARLPGARSDCGRRLGEAVARLLPPEWRGAFADAALNRAGTLSDQMAAAAHAVAAAHASM